jgi:hypothetical protein
VTDSASVSEWMRRYVEAWKAYDRELIGDLFSEQASCRYYPYAEPVRGREAIVESWFEDRDADGTFEAEYEPYAVDGERAVVTGTSSYRDEAGGEIKRVYFNCFAMRFDAEGRCAEFTEWFMLQPEA